MLCLDVYSGQYFKMDDMKRLDDAISRSKTLRDWYRNIGTLNLYPEYLLNRAIKYVDIHQEISISKNIPVTICKLKFFEFETA